MNPVNGPHHYDLYTFTVTQADVYTFDLETTWGDGIMALYQEASIPTHRAAISSRKPMTT
ncbi:MAG: hypothetical protein IPN33_16075 [Saprospiraceae bacterium]|nr:hypothetical protein [Saprospiraceae bacterium]